MEADLQARQGDGATLRQHLQRRARNTGRTDARLDARLPAAAAPVWDVFCLLAGGGEPMRWVEIQAWSHTQGVALTGWELDTLIAMDRALRARLHAQAQPAPGTKGKQ
jgi:hypothetical protein